MDFEKIFHKDACPTSIGGQAIMEGIMMRGPKRTAIAVRLPDGKIHMKTQPAHNMGNWGKIPLVRGVAAFVSSLVFGTTKVLMYSADVLEKYTPEDVEPDKFDQWVEKKFGKEKAWNILLWLSVALALVFSIGVFMLLPTAVVGLFIFVWGINVNLTMGLVFVILLIFVGLAIVRINGMNLFKWIHAMMQAPIYRPYESKGALDTYVKEEKEQ